MKFLKYGFYAILALAALIGVLFALGMKVEMDGTGSRPIITFHKADKHLEQLEKLAKEEQAAAPAPAEPEVAAAAEAPAAEAVPEAAPAPPRAPWPSFYGPNRDGRYTDTPILTAWPGKGLREEWRRPVGGGYASMVVAEGLVFTIEQRRAEEVAAAYDFATGRQRWSSAWAGDFREAMGGPGPRATPTYDEGRVYVLGAEGELRCLDARSGKLQWRKNILEENGAANLQWAMSASPLVVDGKVVVLPGGGGGRSVVAYDKLTGARAWSVLDDKAGYAAPIVATLAGMRQIVALTADRAVGLAIEDGKLLWETPWKTSYDVNSAMPVITGPAQLVLTSGYGTGAKLVDIVREGDTLTARDGWSSQSMKAKFNNVVLHEGVIYGLDEGILAAMDVATGKRLWKGGRYGYGQLLLAQGHLVVSTEQGDVVLVKANPSKHEEIARFGALDGKTWNVPALAEGRLLVRNTTEMACYRIAP
ncbi:MAG: PQQ-binding-like beta-propeller repeat protein [Bryobacteraceae bacterium]|nr:PQQ-binding-like beta-propeller repeat protein [Bryobacteraceae bacterium]